MLLQGKTFCASMPHAHCKHLHAVWKYNDSDAGDAICVSMSMFAHTVRQTFSMYTPLRGVLCVVSLTFLNTLHQAP